MLVKVVKSYRDLVIVCDSEILGKKFEEGKFQLDVRESFYKGEEKSETETVDILKKMAQEDATFNIVGEKAISCAIKAGIISEEAIGTIQGVKFALVLL